MAITLKGSYVFNGADTSTGAAGSTTGLAPTGVVDYLGGTWQIQNGVAIAPGNTGAYCSNAALAPATLDTANVRVRAQYQFNGGTAMLFVRFDRPGQQGFAVRCEPTSLRICQLIGANGFVDVAVEPITLSSGSTYYFQFDAQSTDATHTNYAATIYSDAGYTNAVAAATAPGRTEGPQVAGGAGIGAWTTGSTNKWTSMSIYDLGAPAPVVGQCTAFPVSGSTSQIALSSPTPTGGSGTYTGYQWYYSLTDPAVTSVTGTPLAGATGLSATHTGLSPGQSAYYVLRVTDANGTTVDSFVARGTTYRARYRVGTLIDSLTAGTVGDTAPFVCDVIQQYVRAQNGPNEVVLVNGAIAGMQISQYLPGQPNGNFAAFANNVQAVGGVDVFDIEAATNDFDGGASVSYTLANLQTLIAGLKALCPTAKIILQDTPIHANPGPNAKVQQYNLAMDALADNLSVFRAPGLYAVSNANPSAYDGLHPNATGRTLWGIARGQAVYGVLVNGGISGVVVISTTNKGGFGF